MRLVREVDAGFRLPGYDPAPRHMAAAVVLLRRRGAKCVGDDLLNVVAFAFRAFGQAVECPAVDGNRDGHRDVRFAGRDVDLSSCERLVERVGSVVVNVGHASIMTGQWALR